MTHLVLVRHGQSTWNLERRIQGQTMAVPLTELGRDQARRAAAEVARMVPPGTAVLASDQLRAWQTAEIVARATGSTVRPEPRLREQSMGRLEGLTEAELVPEPAPAGVDIADVRWGGGESLADVSVRLHELLDSLSLYEQVVLVSHELTLRVLLALLDGRTHRDCDFTLAMPNGAVLHRSMSSVASTADRTVTHVNTPGHHQFAPAIRLEPTTESSSTMAIRPPCCPIIDSTRSSSSLTSSWETPN